MKYRITLERMEFRAFHGCYDLEQQVGNRFTVDLWLETELGRVAEEDSVEIAVNYLTVYEVVREVMGRTQRTIERVAMNIIEAIKAADSIDGVAIAEALPNVEIAGVTGSISFDEIGDAKKDMAYIKKANTETVSFDFVKTQTVAELAQ